MQSLHRESMNQVFSAEWSIVKENFTFGRYIQMGILFNRNKKWFINVKQFRVPIKEQNKFIKE